MRGFYFRIKDLFLTKEIPDYPEADCHITVWITRCSVMLVLFHQFLVEVFDFKKYPRCADFGIKEKIQHRVISDFAVSLGIEISDYRQIAIGIIFSKILESKAGLQKQRFVKPVVGIIKRV